MIEILQVNSEDVKTQFVSGKTGTYEFYLTSNTDVVSTLLANDADAKVNVLPSEALSEGSEVQQRAY